MRAQLRSASTIVLLRDINLNYRHSFPFDNNLVTLEPSAGGTVRLRIPNQTLTSRLCGRNLADATRSAAEPTIVQSRMYTNETYRSNIDRSCGRLSDLFERAESGDAVVRADCGIAGRFAWRLGRKEFAMMSILSARPFRRVALAAVISLALVFVTTASAEVPASARRIRVKRSVPTDFVGPPADQPLTAFKCYWVDAAAQYFRNSNRSKLGGHTRRMPRWAVELLLEDRRRLLRGYASNSVWTTRQVLHAISPHVDDELF